LRTKLLTVQETFVEILILENNDPCFYEVNSELYYEDSEIRIEGFIDRLETTEEDFVFTINLNIEDLATETTESYDCELRYER